MVLEIKKEIGYLFKIMQKQDDETCNELYKQYLDELLFRFADILKEKYS